MNRVLAHHGARHPILQVPMGWITRSTLAMAVSRAGSPSRSGLLLKTA